MELYDKEREREIGCQTVNEQKFVGFVFFTGFVNIRKNVFQIYIYFD